VAGEAGFGADFLVSDANRTSLEDYTVRCRPASVLVQVFATRRKYVLVGSYAASLLHTVAKTWTKTEASHRSKVK